MMRFGGGLPLEALLAVTLLFAWLFFEGCIGGAS